MTPGKLQTLAAAAHAESGEVARDFEDGVEFARRVLETEQRERNMFAEAEVRMQRDPEFNTMVRMLGAFALQHGYTPYELKQLAFSAALWASQRMTRGHVFSGRPEDIDPTLLERKRCY